MYSNVFNSHPEEVERKICAFTLIKIAGKLDIRLQFSDEHGIIHLY